MGVVRITVIVVIGALSASNVAAEGDLVERRARQLTSNSRFKVRLSAALSLGKSHDERAVDPLATALRTDSSKTIRRVAVAGLVRLLSKPMSEAAARAGRDALEYAAQNDRDPRVRKIAHRAQLKLAISTPTSRPLRVDNRGGILLALGKPADPRQMAPAGTHSKMIATVTRAIRRNAPDYAVAALPNRGPQRGRTFFIGASIGDVWISRRGRRTEVRCKVTVRVAPFQDGREHFVAGETASAKGSGRVTGGSSEAAIARSKRKCVLAVLEEVTERQVVPFIRRVTAGGR